MKKALYQIVYKSSYHGELFSDSRAIVIKDCCPAADIMEIIKIDVPVEIWDRQEELNQLKNRLLTDGGFNYFFTDRNSAIAAFMSL